MDDRPMRHPARRGLPGGAVLFAAFLAIVAVALPLLRPADPASRPPVAAITLQRTASPPGREISIAVERAADSIPMEQEADSSLADRLVGEWQLEKHGVRTLHLHADGTARVDVRLSMLGALMYGDRMTLESTWALDGDVMTQTISSGTPQQAVKRLIRDWGDRREYRVVEVDDDRLVLSEVGDDEDRDVWTRVSVGSTSATTAKSAASTQQSPR